LPKPDNEDVSSVLLRKAREDLSAAEVLIATEGQSEDVIGFHLQQAVEKALKSILANRNREVPHTHNLGYLVELLADERVEIPKLIERPQWLTPWGVAFRYVTAADALDTDRGLKAATAAVGLAEHVLTRDNTDPAA
jgi:HEPN domain-containing protein